jgi:hypothetical protein
MILASLKLVNRPICFADAKSLLTHCKAHGDYAGGGMGVDSFAREYFEARDFNGLAGELAWTDWLLPRP